MPRIFLPMEGAPDNISITGEKARYLASVLRCHEGDELEILDGKGRSYLSKITSVSRKEVLARIAGSFRRETESPLDLILVQGLLKGEKMDLVVQKVTELGVREVIPVASERSQMRFTEKAGRWHKIAEEASRQSGRVTVPLIHGVIPFDVLFSGASQYTPYFKRSKGIFFWEKEGIPLKEIGDSVKECTSLVIAVGPEGGFTEKEARLAESVGFLTVSLGNRILRAETAAIAAVSLAQFLFGDLGD